MEYYFGYQFAENDFVCEDWRSRDQSWKYCAIALDFFRNSGIAIENTMPADELVGNSEHNNSVYCLAVPQESYLVYLPKGDAASLDLRDAKGEFKVEVLNPRSGEREDRGTVSGGDKATLSSPGKQHDWLFVLRKQ